MTATEHRAGQRTASGAAAVEADGEGYRVRPTGSIGFIEARTLERECLSLLDRGAGHLVLDLGRTEVLGPAALGTLAAIDRYARRMGARFLIALGSESLTHTLSRSGLLTQLEVEGASDTFFDWTR